MLKDRIRVTVWGVGFDPETASIVTAIAGKDNLSYVSE